MYMYVYIYSNVYHTNPIFQKILKYCTQRFIHIDLYGVCTLFLKIKCVRNCSQNSDFSFAGGTCQNTELIQKGDLAISRRHCNTLQHVEQHTATLTPMRKLKTSGALENKHSATQYNTVQHTHQMGSLQICDS